MSGPTGPSLVIAGHGSRQAQWLKAFEDLVEAVRANAAVKMAFRKIRAGYLENARPSLAEVVQQELAQGASEVWVVPVFVNVSQLLYEDIPGVLGLNTLPHVRRRLQGEGIELCPEGLPVHLQTLGPLEEMLFRNVQRRLQLTSREPTQEGVVLVAFGSALYHDAWEGLLGSLHLKLADAGFRHSGHSYCGQRDPESQHTLEELIRRLSRESDIKRLHLLPLLLAPSDLQTSFIGKIVETLQPELKRKGVSLLYESEAILPDGDLAAFVAMRSLDGLGVSAALGAFSRGNISLA